MRTASTSANKPPFFQGARVKVKEGKSNSARAVSGKHSISNNIAAVVRQVEYDPEEMRWWLTFDEGKGRYWADDFESA